MSILISLLFAVLLTALLVFNHVRLGAPEIFKHLPIFGSQVSLNLDSGEGDIATHHGCSCPACQKQFAQIQGKLPPTA